MLSDLKRVVQVLGETVVMLEEKLKPVLHDCEAPKPDPSRDQPATRCGLGADLWEQYIKLDGVAKAAHSLLERIEL